MFGVINRLKRGWIDAPCNIVGFSLFTCTDQYRWAVKKSDVTRWIVDHRGRESDYPAKAPLAKPFASHLRPCSKMTDFKRRAGAEINI